MASSALPDAAAAFLGDVQLQLDTRLDEVLATAHIRNRYPLLALACEASPDCGLTIREDVNRVADRADYLILDRNTPQPVYLSQVAVALAALDAQVDFAAGIVLLPSQSGCGKQRFRKISSRDQMPIPPLSIAAAKRTDGEVRLVLGGVSPTPYRIYSSVEEETMSGGLDADTIDGLVERALLDAEATEGNSYRLEIAAQLLREAIADLSIE